MTGRPRDESGAVAVVVAFFSVVMFALGAIVVDLGQARGLRVQAQTGADAAALAATNAIYAAGTAVPDVSGAVSAAKAYASSNLGVSESEWGSCADPTRPAGYVVPSGSTACISFSPDLTRPGRVRIAMPTRASTSYFSGALGVGTPYVGAIAEADIRINRPSPCALCVLGPNTHDFGQGDVRVYGGSIALNGSVNVGANGMLAANGSILIEGTTTGPQYASPAPTNGSPRVDDPLADHPLPSATTGYAPFGPLSVRTNPCSSTTGGPGIYGSFSFPSGVTCTLSPGLYVIVGTSGTGHNTPGTWDLSGSTGTVLRGTGVTLLFTCGTTALPRNCEAGALGVGENGAGLSVTGSGRVELAAPQTGQLAGFTIIFDRNNKAFYKVSGGGSSTVTGTVYMPKGTAVMNGNGCIDSYSVLFVAGDLATNGNGSCLNMPYVPSQAAQLRPDQRRLTK